MTARAEELEALERDVGALSQRLALESSSTWGDLPSSTHWAQPDTFVSDGMEIVALAKKRILLPSAEFKQRRAWDTEELQRALMTHKVFNVQAGVERYYPFFFVLMAKDPGTLKRLEDLCKQLGSLSGFLKLKFYLTPQPFLRGQTPLHALADGRLQTVNMLAAQYIQMHQ